MSNFVNAKKATAKKPRSQTSLSVSGSDAPAATSSSSSSSLPKTKRASGSLSSVGHREELDSDPVEVKSSTGRVRAITFECRKIVQPIFFFFFSLRSSRKTLDCRKAMCFLQLVRRLPHQQRRIRPRPTLPPPRRRSKSCNTFQRCRSARILMSPLSNTLHRAISLL
jgi:hypothetical protein